MLSVNYREIEKVTKDLANSKTKQEPVSCDVCPDRNSVGS